MELLHDGVITRFFLTIWISLVLDETVTNRPTEQPTDRPERDGQPGYRDARTHLKSVSYTYPVPRPCAMREKVFITRATIIRLVFVLPSKLKRSVITDREIFRYSPLCLRIVLGSFSSMVPPGEATEFTRNNICHLFILTTLSTSFQHNF